MSAEFTHNPNLPAPKDVLLVDPKVLLLDGVESISLTAARGFWTPKKYQSFGFSEEFSHILPTSIAPEVFNQFAGYVAAHGLREPKIPLLRGSDSVRWRRIITVGDPVEIELATTSLGEESYRAEGVLKVAGEVACRGSIMGTLHEADFNQSIYNADNIYRTETTEWDVRNDLRFIEAEEGEILNANLTLLERNIIDLDGHIIRLSSVQKYILEKLVESRGSFLTARQIYTLPDFPSESSPFSRQAVFSPAKNALRKTLISSEGKALITQKSGTKRRQFFQLNPGVKVNQ